MTRNAARNAVATAAVAGQLQQTRAILATSAANGAVAAAQRNAARQEVAEVRAAAAQATRNAAAAAATQLANAVAAESRAVTQREKANATRRITAAISEAAIASAEQTALASAAQQEAAELRAQINAAQAAARNGSAAHTAELARLQAEQQQALAAAAASAKANLNAARNAAAAAARAAENAHSAAAQRAAQNAAAALAAAQAEATDAREAQAKALAEKNARQTAARAAYNAAKRNFNPNNINKAQALLSASNLLLTFGHNSDVKTNRNAANAAIKKAVTNARNAAAHANRQKNAAASAARAAINAARRNKNSATAAAAAAAAEATARAEAAEAAAAEARAATTAAGQNMTKLTLALAKEQKASKEAAEAAAQASAAANARVRTAEAAVTSATTQQERNRANKEAALARAAAVEAEKAEVTRAKEAAEAAKEAAERRATAARGNAAASATRIRELEGKAAANVETALLSATAGWMTFKSNAKKFVNSLAPVNKSQGLGKALAEAQNKVNKATNNNSKSRARVAYTNAKSAWNARPRGGAATTSFKTLLNNYSRATASKKFQEWKPIMNSLRANNKSSAQSEDKIAFGVLNKEFTKYNQLLTRVRNINATQRARNFERLNAAWKNGNAAGWRRSNLNKLQQAYLLYFNANGKPKGGAGGGGGGNNSSNNNGGVPPGYKNSGNKIYFSFEKNGRHVSGLKRVITDSRGIGYIYTSKHGAIPILTNKTTIQVRKGTMKKNMQGYKLNLNRKANASSRTWAVIKAGGGPPARAPSGGPSNFAKTLMEATNKLHINANGKTPVKANNLQRAMTTRVSWSNNTSPNKIGGLGWVYVAKGPPTAYYIKKDGTNKFYPVVQAVAGIGGNRTRYVISTKNINNKNAPRGNPSILPK